MRDVPLPSPTRGKPPSKPPTPKSGGGDKSSGGGGKTPQQKADASARAAENRAVARANAEKKKAGKRFLEGAANLKFQIDALKHALKTDFKSARNNNLRDINKVLGQQFGLLKEGHTKRAAEFLESGKDNAKATGGVAERGFSNLVRERQDTMSAILEQGAGETDTMRALLMSARNWHSNASESNRAFFDTRASINSGINDLNIDTKTELANASVAAEADKERIWQNYYDRRSESYTQLGNTYGQQADYYAQAKEMGVKPKRGAEKKAEKAMKKAFMDASKESGKSYTNAGLPDWISGYQGQAKLTGTQSNANLAAAVTFDKLEKAEGANLRTWAG
jgi:hypothetical protein